MIPKEVMRSFDRFSKIIYIIENKLELTKEEILREMYIELDSDYENIKKIFRRYYNGECGVDGYIIRRKIYRTIEEIVDVNDMNIQNKKIRDINGKTRSEFSRMIKQRYNFSLKDLLKNKDKVSILEERIDVRAIYGTFKKVEKSLVKLEQLGLFDVNYKRTKLQFTNFNIQGATEILLKRDVYIYYGEIPKNENDRINYVVSMIGNDEILENWKVIKSNIQKRKYNNGVTFKELTKLDERVEEVLLDNSCYFCEEGILNNPLIINGLAYFFIDRSDLKESIKNFKLPTRLESYKTILFRTKSFMEEVCLYNLNFKLGNFDNEMINKTKQKLLIYSQYDIKYNYNLAVVEVIKKMDIMQKEVFYLILYIEDNDIKEMSLLEGYRILKSKYSHLTRDSYENSFKELLLKGFISIKSL